MKPHLFRMGGGMGLGRMGLTAAPLGEATPTIGIAANRTQVPTYSSAITAPYTSRRSHFTPPGSAIIDLVFIDVGWALAPLAITDLGYTIKRYVEYPAGVFTQVTWSAATSVAVPAGGQTESDPVGVTIPADTEFWERTVVTASATVPQIELPAAHTSLGLPDGSVSADQGNSGSIAAGSNPYSVGAAAILGTHATPQDTFLLIGDSICWGQGDTGSVSARDGTGYMARAIDPDHAYTKIAVGGLRAQHLAAYLAGSGGNNQLANFIAALEFTDVWQQLGINDLTYGSRSLVQMTADWATIESYCDPAATHHQSTLTPRTINSTTPDTQGTLSILSSVNDAIFDGLNSVAPSNVKHVAEIAMSAHNSRIWRTGMSTDWSHPDQTGHTDIADWVSGRTSDTTPQAFAFTDATAVALDSEQVSDSISVWGINSPATVTITGGEYEKNLSGVWTSAAGTASLGDTFRVRHTASGSNSTAVDTVLTIGGVSDTFTSTTLASGGGGGPYTFTNADAEAYVARMTALGEEPDSAQKERLDALFVAIASVRSKLPILYIVGHAENSSKLNAGTTGDANNLTEVGTVAFVPYRYFKGDGTTGYLNTDFALGAGRQNSAHVGVYVRDNTQQAVGHGNTNCLITPRISTNNAVFRLNANTGGGSNDASVTDGSGHSMASRTASNLTQGYKNGAAAWTTNTAASVTPSTETVRICGRISSGTMGYNSNEVQIYHAGDGLSAGEATILASAFDAYCDAIELV